MCSRDDPKSRILATSNSVSHNNAAYSHTLIIVSRSYLSVSFLYRNTVRRALEREDKNEMEDRSSRRMRTLVTQMAPCPRECRGLPLYSTVATWSGRWLVESAAQRGRQRRDVHGADAAGTP